MTRNFLKHHEDSGSVGSKTETKINRFQRSHACSTYPLFHVFLHQKKTRLGHFLAGVFLVFLMVLNSSSDLGVSCWPADVCAKYGNYTYCTLLCFLLGSSLVEGLAFGPRHSGTRSFCACVAVLTVEWHTNSHKYMVQGVILSNKQKVGGCLLLWKMLCQCILLCGVQFKVFAGDLSDFHGEDACAEYAMLSVWAKRSEGKPVDLG